jgi:hypothetical protein
MQMRLGRAEEKFVRCIIPLSEDEVKDVVENGR